MSSRGVGSLLLPLVTPHRPIFNDFSSPPPLPSQSYVSTPHLSLSLSPISLSSLLTPPSPPLSPREERNPKEQKRGLSANPKREEEGRSPFHSQLLQQAAAPRPPPGGGVERTATCFAFIASRPRAAEGGGRSIATGPWQCGRRRSRRRGSGSELRGGRRLKRKQICGDEGGEGKEALSHGKERGGAGAAADERGRGERGGEVEALRQLRQRRLLRLRRHCHPHLHVPRHGHLRALPPAPLRAPLPRRGWRPPPTRFPPRRGLRRRPRGAAERRHRREARLPFAQDVSLFKRGFCADARA